MSQRIERGYGQGVGHKSPGVPLSQGQAVTAVAASCSGIAKTRPAPNLRAAARQALNVEEG